MILLNASYSVSSQSLCGRRLELDIVSLEVTSIHVPLCGEGEGGECCETDCVVM